MTAASVSCWNVVVYKVGPACRAGPRAPFVAPNSVESFSSTREMNDRDGLSLRRRSHASLRIARPFQVPPAGPAGRDLARRLLHQTPLIILVKQRYERRAIDSAIVSRVVSQRSAVPGPARQAGPTPPALDADPRERAAAPLPDPAT